MEKRWTIKRILLVCLTVILAFCISICFLGCKSNEEVGQIPNGKYCRVPPLDKERYAYVEEGRKLPTDHYLSIAGDKVKIFISGSNDFRGKIVARENKIYFEGYTWKNILWGKQGKNDVYEVEYNEETKMIIITLLKND